MQLAFRLFSQRQRFRTVHQFLVHRVFVCQLRLLGQINDSDFFIFLIKNGFHVTMQAVFLLRPTWGNSLVIEVHYTP